MKKIQLKIIIITLGVVFISAEAMAENLPEVRVSNVRRVW